MLPRPEKRYPHGSPYSIQVVGKAFEKRQSHPQVIPVCLGNNPLWWFTNYLQERQQCCIIDGISSKNLPVAIGVPQGSILASFLFSGLYK